MKLQSFKDKKYDVALKECFMNLDRLLDTPEGRTKLHTYSKEKPNGGFGGDSASVAHRAGTTVVVCLVTKDKIYCSNAGDSRAVMSRKGGIAEELSHDHKPNLPEEKKRIEAANHYVE